MELVSENKRKLRIVLSLTLAFMVTEIIAGFWSGSLALLADAGHMLTDAGAMALSLLVLWLSEKPPTPRRTFGFRRTEILAALANGLTLWVTVGIIAHEAYHCFKNPPEILAGPMLWVAVGGLLANLTSAWVLRTSHQHNLNMKGAYLHVMMDCWGSVGVIVAALVISKTGYTRVDPIVSLLICALILYSSWGIVKESVIILLEATPPHINLDEIAGAMQQTENVQAVHDLHVWTITSGFDALSVHVSINDSAKGDKTLNDLRTLLKQRFNINHSAVQLEGEPCGVEENCLDGHGH